MPILFVLILFFSFSINLYAWDTEKPAPLSCDKFPVLSESKLTLNTQGITTHFGDDGVFPVSVGTSYLLSIDMPPGVDYASLAGDNTANSSFVFDGYPEYPGELCFEAGCQGVDTSLMNEENRISTPIYYTGENKLSLAPMTTKVKTVYLGIYTPLTFFRMSGYTIRFNFSNEGIGMYDRWKKAGCPSDQSIDYSNSSAIENNNISYKLPLPSTSTVSVDQELIFLPVIKIENVTADTQLKTTLSITPTSANLTLNGATATGTPDITFDSSTTGTITGVNETNMVLNGTLEAINTALNGMSFISDTAGEYTLSITTLNTSNSTSVTNNLSINVTDVDSPPSENNTCTSAYCEEDGKLILPSVTFNDKFYLNLELNITGNTVDLSGLPNEITNNASLNIPDALAETITVGEDKIAFTIDKLQTKETENPEGVKYNLAVNPINGQAQLTLTAYDVTNGNLQIRTDDDTDTIWKIGLDNLDAKICRDNDEADIINAKTFNSDNPCSRYISKKPITLTINDAKNETYIVRMTVGENTESIKFTVGPSELNLLYQQINDLSNQLPDLKTSNDKFILNIPFVSFENNGEKSCWKTTLSSPLDSVSFVIKDATKLTACP